MEEVINPSAEPLFNGPLETGVRTVVLLNAVHPAKLDLASLTLLDHLVVHTQDLDVNGPSSLHPNLPQRSGEMLVRRRLIEDGVRLMRRFGMIVAHADETGIVYEASEDAFAFAELLRTEYGVQLKDRAKWLANRISAIGDAGLVEIANEKLGRWSAEFQISEGSVRGGRVE